MIFSIVRRVLGNFLIYTQHLKYEQLSPPASGGGRQQKTKNTADYTGMQYKWEGHTVQIYERKVNQTMKRKLSVFLALVMLLALAAPAASAAEATTLTEKYAQFDSQYLPAQWSYATYCYEECYAADPIVVDLDGDGKLEAITAAWTVTVADAASGSVKWQIPKSGRQVYCTPVAADLDGDGKLELIVGYGDGVVNVYSGAGQSKWTAKVSPWGDSVRSLAAADVDGDGKQEVIIGLGAKAESLYVYSHDGQPKPGCISGQIGTYSDSMWGNGLATGDMDGDGLPEIVAPLDNYAVAAYNGDGTHVMVSSEFKSDGDHFDFGGKIPWLAVSLFEDYGEELRRANGGLGGWGLTYESLEEKGRKGTYGPGMTYSTARFADIDGDGTQEVVITATMFDRTVRFQTPDDINCFDITHAQYSTVYIYNGDHTRFNKNGCDWTSIPTNLTAPLGKPLNQNPMDGSGYKRALDGGINSVPVVGDINGDGVKDILFNAFDGKVHCFSAKDSSKELAGWPFTLPGNSSGSYFEFPAEPTLADVNGDGKLEVVVVSWTETESSKHPAIPRTGQNGSIYVLDGSGKLLTQQKLEPMITYDNVSRSKPVVADIDGDKQMEILISSSDYGGLVAYDVVGGAATQTPAQPTNPTQPAQKLADARDQKVVINGGEPIVLHAFGLKDANGNYTNYVSVRDLAWVMSSGSGAFDVTWDSTAKAINLVTGKNYSNPTGNEGKAVFTGSQPYNQDPVKILVDGKEVKLELINIGNGNTYYKLRDLGSALGFTVGWDQAAAAATITTK